MKRYKYLFLLLIIGLIEGCSDLEENPVGLLAPEGLFTSLDDVQLTVNGAIGVMASETHWGRKASLPIMLRGDLVSIGDQGTPQRRKDVDLFQMTDDNGMITVFWGTTYQMIAACNEGIAGAETLTSIPEERVNSVKAQAHFVKAWSYYLLVRLFGEVPYLDSPVVSGDDSGSLPKSSVDEIYENIIADLEYAKTWLPDRQPTRALPSKATAAAYLASVHLTLATLNGNNDQDEFQSAYEEAKFVIDNEGTFDLTLEDDFQVLFDADETGNIREPLWNLDFNSFTNGNNGNDYHAALTGIRANEKGGIGGGWSVAVPTVEVYNTWDGRDYRKEVSLDTTGIFNGIVEPFTRFPDFDARNIQSAYIAKYTRFPGQTASGNGRASARNYAMMRYAEVLLIAAEALNEISPGSAEAVGYVNRVRARARMGNGSAFPADVAAGLSLNDFRDLVLEERKWELAFEFKRWFDIKRRRLGTEVFGPGGLENQPNFNPDRDYLFPLPGDELVRNPNLAPNNDGY